MPDFKNRGLCVFAGSSPGGNPLFKEAAASLGRELARNGITLVFGGGKVGLMGALADAVLDCGGRVVGVIPEALKLKEVAHEGLTELRVVASMHERKALMAELSDGFVALPGGIGTYEELFEIYTWGQLGIHAKPCAILNAGGFYDGLIGFLDHAVAEGFLGEFHRNLLIVDSDPARLLSRIRAFEAPPVRIWLGPKQA